MMKNILKLDNAKIVLNELEIGSKVSKVRWTEKELLDGIATVWMMNNLPPNTTKFGPNSEPLEGYEVPKFLADFFLTGRISLTSSLNEVPLVLWEVGFDYETLTQEEMHVLGRKIYAAFRQLSTPSVEVLTKVGTGAKLSDFSNQLILDEEFVDAEFDKGKLPIVTIYGGNMEDFHEGIKISRAYQYLGQAIVNSIG